MEHHAPKEGRRRQQVTQLTDLLWKPWLLHWLSLSRRRFIGLLIIFQKTWMRNHFLMGGGGETFSWLMSVGFWCENMSVKNLSSSIYVRRSRSRRSFIRLRADIQPHDTLTAISVDEPMHSSSEILSMLIMRWQKHALILCVCTSCQIQCI